MYSIFSFLSLLWFVRSNVPSGSPTDSHPYFPDCLYKVPGRYPSREPALSSLPWTPSRCPYLLHPSGQSHVIRRVPLPCVTPGPRMTPPPCSSLRQEPRSFLRVRCSPTGGCSSRMWTPRLRYTSAFARPILSLLHETQTRTSRSLVRHRVTSVTLSRQGFWSTGLFYGSGSLCSRLGNGTSTALDTRVGNLYSSFLRQGSFYVRYTTGTGTQRTVTPARRTQVFPKTNFKILGTDPSSWIGTQTPSITGKDRRVETPGVP